MDRKTVKLLSLLLAVLLTAGSFAACTQSSEPAEEPQTETQEEPSETSDQIASEDEKIAREDVVEEGMIPVAAADIKDGVYEVQVDSSSGMFVVTGCILTVENGSMTADITLSGDGYRYLYLGTPEEAASAPESDYLMPQIDENGVHHYTFAVDALDQGIDCAAFSDKKEKRYDRILVFRASSLSLSDFRDGFIKTASTLGLADGDYTCEVSLSGGSGKASVASPANLTVRGGRVTAEIIWSSDKYDYMVVNGAHYDPISTENGSTFLIPVDAFDFSLTVIADTIAMSTPHEIEYTLNFDSSTIQ